MILKNIKNDHKYKCEKLGVDSDELKTVRDFFNTTTANSTKRDNSPGFNVYKVMETDPSKQLEEKSNNLMLFHGTNSKGVEGILTEGYKNSKKGCFGKGVYMTDCSDTAGKYCISKSKTDSSGTAELFDKNIYIFVNEVLESGSLKIIKHSKIEMKFERYFKPKHSFEKHVYEGSQKLTEKNFKEDDLGRKYRNIAVKNESELDEYVADENLVVPRYIIVISAAKMSLNNNNILVVDGKLIKNKSLNIGSELIKGNSLNPDSQNTYKITPNISLDLNKLQLFARDFGTINAYCNKVEHKPSKPEYLKHPSEIELD